MYPGAHPISFTQNTLADDTERASPDYFLVEDGPRVRATSGVGDRHTIGVRHDAFGTAKHSLDLKIARLGTDSAHRISSASHAAWLWFDVLVVLKGSF